MCKPFSTKLPIHFLRSHKHFLYGIILLFSPILTYAEESDATRSNISEYVDSQRLYEAATWIKLIHYKKITNSKVKSEIVTPTFFLDELGDTSPRNELLANVHAFMEAGATDNNDDLHAQCKFPARFSWIAFQMKPLELKFPEVHCGKYKKWKDEAQIESISLIYASGFFENPASFYGHLLLKLNSATAQGGLLDTSVNYGAHVPENENALFYIVKGIFGGYDSRFSYNYYYKNRNIYSQIEMRDMWEYQLNFSKEEVDFIANHIWELLQYDFSYFFIKQNCAYRVAELIELPLTKDIIDKKKPWILPIDVVKGVYDYDDLLKSFAYTPSKRTTFIKKYLASNPGEKKNIHAFINSGSSAFLRDKSIDNSSKSRMIDELFDYYASLYVDDYENPDYVKKHQQLLAEQLRLPPTRISHTLPDEEPPHQGLAPSLLQTSAFYNEKMREGIHFRLRPAYYDFLSKNTGHKPYSGLSMLDVTLTYVEDKLMFRSIDLLRLDNLDIAQTDIDALSNHSWNLRLGLEPKELSCISCTVSFLEGGLGKGYATGKDFAFYAFAEGRLQSKTRGMFSGTPKIGFMGKIMNGWYSHAFIGYRKFVGEAENSSIVALFENRFGNHSDWDSRLTVKKQDSTEAAISFNYYW